jgi:putative FmdB family regulatory protein
LWASGIVIYEHDQKVLDFVKDVIILNEISVGRFVMPIYEYVCQGCKEEFEIMQRITEAPINVCSKCGGTLRKLISSNSFILKGSGWYVTDYGSKKGNEGKPRKKDPPTETSPEKKKSKEAPKKDDS